MVARRAAHDVEHFQDRHAAADQLSKGSGEARHADLMHERSEDRELEFPPVTQLAAARRAQEGADTENSATDSEDHEIPFRRA